MNNKFKFGIIAVIVVLAVAVIGLYFREPKLAATNSTNTYTQQGTTGFDSITYLGEVTAGKRELKMAASTSTLTFDNLSGDDLLISDLILAIPASERAAESYVWGLATTSLPLESGTAVGVTNFTLGYWVTATSSTATSTSLTKLSVYNKAVSYVNGNATGGQASTPTPFILRNGERILLRLYTLGNVLGVGGLETRATSTSRGFDPTLKFDFQTIQ